MKLRAHPERRDWWIWDQPDLDWCARFGDVPGIQAFDDGHGGAGGIIFHRTHLPVMPEELRARCRMMSGIDGSFDMDIKLYGRGIKLRSYQSDDLPFLRSRRGTLLAYEMRLGKTLAACAAHDPADGMLVVVGPLISRDVWREWIEKVHGVPPFVLEGRTNIEPQPGYPAYFVHYDVLEAWTKFFVNERIGTLVLDEVHLLQSGRAKRTQAAGILAVRSSRVIGLSGTPMWNSPDSLYSILHLITPGAWGSHHPYGVRYAGAHSGSHGWCYGRCRAPFHSGMSDELRSRLDEMMVRRTWAEVAPDLPPTTRVVDTVELPMAKLVEIEGLTMQSMQAHAQGGVAVFEAKLRVRLGMLKAAHGAKLATRAMLDGHQVVLWCWHNAVADDLVVLLQDIAPLFPVFRLRASDSQDVRSEQIEGFQKAGRPSAMVAGIAVGGTAIDLSCATHGIFVEVDWTPANNAQAAKRTFHPSRPDCLTFLAADAPIEMRLFEALGVREGFAASLGLDSGAIGRMVLG